MNPFALLLRAAAGGEAEGVGAAFRAGAAAARVLAQRHQLAAEHAQALRAGERRQGHPYRQRPRLRRCPGALAGRMVYSSWLSSSTRSLTQHIASRSNADGILELPKRVV